MENRWQAGGTDIAVSRTDTQAKRRCDTATAEAGAVTALMREDAVGNILEASGLWPECGWACVRVHLRVVEGGGSQGEPQAQA